LTAQLVTQLSEIAIARSRWADRADMPVSVQTAAEPPRTLDFL
jgi:hypothetical protein